MKITPLAFDSLGTRSMATWVETKECKILIDPGVSLAPMKSGYPPHPIELKREEEHWQKIKKVATKCDILIVTHYHYDHYNPAEPEIYKDKIAFLKHPREKINRSQLERAQEFLEKIKDLPKELHYCDGEEFCFGGTKIKFSSAVPHGNVDRLGYVIQVSISDGEHKFLHTSDVEGANLEEQVRFIVEENPNLLFFDGPMTYPFQNIIPNMIKILQNTKVERFIIDHHYVRKTKWRDKILQVYKVADALGKKLLCAAEFLGVPEDFLEVKRKELYKQYPVGEKK